MIYNMRPGIPWYVMLFLEFLPMKYAHDHVHTGDSGVIDKNVTLCYKTFMGKMYVLSQITTDEDPA